VNEPAPGPRIPPAPDPETPVMIRLADAQECLSAFVMIEEVGLRYAVDMPQQRAVVTAIRDRLVIAINDAVRKAKGRPT
jgi:hypothetical protein